VAVVS